MKCLVLITGLLCVATLSFHCQSTGNKIYTQAEFFVQDSYNCKGHRNLTTIKYILEYYHKSRDKRLFALLTNHSDEKSTNGEVTRHYYYFNCKRSDGIADSTDNCRIEIEQKKNDLTWEQICN